MKYHHPKQNGDHPFPKAMFILMTPTIAMVFGLPLARGLENADDASLQIAAKRIVAACVAKIEEDPNLSKWEKTIHIDPFIESDSPQKKVTLGIAQRLADEFQKLNYKVDPKGHFRMRGTISKKVGLELPDDDVKSPALEIAPELVDENGDTIWPIQPITVFTRDGIQQLGPNFSVAPDLPLETQVTTLLDHLDHPQPFISEKTRLFPRNDAPFGIEILVADETRPIVVDNEGRNPTVHLQSGDEYRVRIHNQAPFAAGVRLSIDGVSMFCMAKDLSVDSLIVVPPGETIEVRGWWIRAQGKGGMRAFKAGEAAESVAAQLKHSTPEIGTISAAFHAMWQRDEMPPADEALGTRGSLGTQQGIELSTDNPVVKNMVFGVCRATVSVTYDAVPN